MVDRGRVKRAEQPWPKAPPRPANGPPVILVVEDNQPLGAMVVRILEEAGYTVIGPAESSVDSLQVLFTDTFDAALLDVGLVDRAIYPLAGRLEERGIPFAFCTGTAPESISPEFQHVSVLRKPFEPEALLAQVRDLLDGCAATDDDGA